MKKIILILAACITLVAFESGCKTSDTPPPWPIPTNSPPAQVESVRITAGVVEMSAQLSTYLVVKSDENARPYFETAVVALNAAVNRGEFDPVAISNILARITINGADSPIVYVTTTAALTLYKFAWASAVDKQLDKHVFVKPVLQALSNGITLGLNSIRTEKKFNLGK